MDGRGGIQTGIPPLLKQKLADREGTVSQETLSEQFLRDLPPLSTLSAYMGGPFG